MREIKYKDSEIKLSLVDENRGQVPGLPKNPASVTKARYEACRDVIEKSDDTMLQLRQVVVYPYSDRYVIISGHTRVRACKELGKDSIPVRILDPSTPSEYLAELAIKSNVDYGEFDVNAMQADFDMRTILDCGIDPEIFSFDYDEEDYIESEEEYAIDVDDDTTFDEMDLPDELHGVSIVPDEIEKIEGDDERISERVTVWYRPEQKRELEKIIGVDIDKVVFHITELRKPIDYMEFENE